jgi:hypothetical protein
VRSRPLLTGGWLPVGLDQPVEIVGIEQEPPAYANAGNAALRPKPPYVSVAEAGVDAGHPDGKQGTLGAAARP